MDNLSTEALYSIVYQLFPQWEEGAYAEPSNEIFYRIIDPEYSLPASDVDIVPTVTVNGSTMTAITRTAYLRREIPIQDGFTPRDFIEMGYRLGCNHMHLMHELVRTPNRGGITADLISAVLLIVYRQTVDGENTENGIQTIPISDQLENRSRHVRFPPQLMPTESVPEDGICPICLETPPSSPTPSQEEEEQHAWSTAIGCNLHSFHTECIQRWMGGSCPQCRAPLVRRDGEQ